ncbi:MAG: PBP1A family penicillin-binding protein [Hyphomonadaceae bacterium]|nr:PBP1A family penicillin-binding protein [Hyphomonadaceae bacterium]
MAEDETPPPGDEPKPAQPDAPSPGAATPTASPAETASHRASEPEPSRAPPPPRPPRGVLVEARDAILPPLILLAASIAAVAAVAWAGVRSIRRPRTISDAAVWAGWGAGAVVLAFVGFFGFVTWGMPSADDVWEARQGQSITFLDRNGQAILREGAQNAPPVDLKTLPAHVAQAFVAIEDRRFYSHIGVDFGGLMRATTTNLSAGRVVQGGSTITQQLAKNLFLTNNRTFRRKLQEAALALWLEQRFSKDQILALYLSRVYFGASAYGIEAAAERYFDRPARDLTLLQAAMLAGLVKAPSRLNPAQQEAGARARAEVVLDEMVAQRFITAEEREAALREPLLISRNNPAGNLGYFRDYIEATIEREIGDQRDDFIVETTLDLTAQRAAERILNAKIDEEGEARRFSQGAVLAIDKDGGVRTMVGGRAYGRGPGQSEFNRTIQSRRQPGSSFKFFIYLAAMENGLTPWTIRVDAPITIGDWSPGNYEDRYYGALPLVSAFARSLNMVAISITEEIGGDKAIAAARRLGVTSPLFDYRSLALGAQELTLMELTQAYAVMAAEGMPVEAHGVTRILRARDRAVVYQFRPSRTERVIAERPLRYMNLIMSRGVEAGTSTSARIEGRAIGGKTGTTNDYRDAWFIGFTPGLAAGVWIGNDDHRIRMLRVTGGQAPAAVWHDFMVVAMRDLPPRPLQLPGPGDYDSGPPAPVTDVQILAPSAVVGAPLGPRSVSAQTPADDGADRSLDFGPEG